MVQQFALADDEQQVLWALLHDPATPPRLAQRAQIILLAAYGRSVAGIAREVGLSRATVRVWLTRVQRHGLAGLDLPAVPAAAAPWPSLRHAAEHPRRPRH